MRASDLILDSQSSLLLKGPFGHGKTLAACSFAVDGPVWLAYWDKKKPVELVHYFHKIIKRPELLKNIDIDLYDSHNANEFLNKLFTLAKDCRYFAIINDSVTKMTAGAVNWSLGFRDNKKGNPSNQDKIMPGFDEYKIETSLVAQSLDICQSLPCHVIWTCHPVPSIKVEGAGTSIRVTKANPIVTYGSKVAGIVPGAFSEIYHFSKESAWDSTGKTFTKYKVSTEALGDDFAKSNIGLKGEFDISNRMFYEVWKEQVAKLKEEMNESVKQHNATTVIPFTNIPSTVNQTNNPTNEPSKWKV